MSIGVLGALLLFVPRIQPADAALLYTTPREATAAPGDAVVVSVLLDSEGEDINVVSVSLRYPPALLEALSVSRGNSFLTLWPEEPVIDPATGTVSFAGGLPDGSVVFGGEVASVLLRVRDRGAADVEPDNEESGVYLNDGAGTLAELTVSGSELTLSDTDPLTPQIASPSHPDEAVWYANRNVTVSWRAVDPAQYSYLLSRDALEAPDDTPDAERSLYYPVLSDGVWYFSVTERLPGDVWGPVARRRFMIDGTPPEPFNIERTVETISRDFLFTFSTVDHPSGVARWEALVTRPRLSWLPFFFRGSWERVINPLVLDSGELTGTVAVRAVDAAGNIREATTNGSDLAPARTRFFGRLGIIALVIALFVLVRRYLRRL